MRPAACQHRAMSVLLEMRVFELLAARLCHELVGPVAAIGNGVELLGEDDPQFVAEAQALVGTSARQAGSRLQFYRFAYGFGRGGDLTGPAPHELVASLFNETRIGCDYRAGARALPLEWQKLACNLAVLAAEALPRGGRLVVDADALGPSVEGFGEAAGLSPEARAALALTAPIGELTSRTAQAYFTGLLARSLGCRLVDMPGEEGGFRVAAAR